MPGLKSQNRGPQQKPGAGAAVIPPTHLDGPMAGLLEGSLGEPCLTDLRRVSRLKNLFKAISSPSSPPLASLNRIQPADPQPTTQGGWAGVVERGEAEVGGVAKNFEL